MTVSLESLLIDLTEVLSVLRGLAREIRCQVEESAGVERDQEAEDRSLMDEVTRLLGDV